MKPAAKTAKSHTRQFRDRPVQRSNCRSEIVKHDVEFLGESAPLRCDTALDQHRSRDIDHKTLLRRSPHRMCENGAILLAEDYGEKGG